MLKCIQCLRRNGAHNGCQYLVDFGGIYPRLPVRQRGGNLQGISRLVEGMEAEEAIKRLEGIRCGFKPTSCPDQLAQALKQAREGT